MPSEDSDKPGHLPSLMSHHCALLPLYLIETPFNTFENRADPDQGLLCLLMEI